jgi:hypothetical protein
MLIHYTMHKIAMGHKKWAIIVCIHPHQQIFKQIKLKTHVSLDPSRVFGQESCQKNDHFLPTNPEKPIFHENLYVFFSRFLDTHARNILLIDDMPCKSLFKDLCSVIFFELFEGSHRNHGNYLLYIVLPYLVSLHSSGFSVQTYIRHNPLGSTRSISCSDFYYNMLFEVIPIVVNQHIVQKQN